MSALRDEIGMDEVLAKLDALQARLDAMITYTGPELLTVDQFAQMRGVTPRTVGRWMKEGRIVVDRIGKTPMIPREQAIQADQQSRTR